MSKGYSQLDVEDGNEIAAAGAAAANMETPKEGTDIWTVAIHEAAHAVVGRLLGIHCGRVTIEPEDDLSYGSAVLDDPRFSWKPGDGRKRDAANKFAMALYAGAEAERGLLKLKPTLDGVDRERATATLAWAGAVRGAAYIGDEKFDRHEAHLRVRASTLVRQHAEKIRAVADALLNQVTLSSDEVDAIADPLAG